MKVRWLGSAQLTKLLQHGPVESQRSR